MLALITGCGEDDKPDRETGENTELDSHDGGAPGSSTGSRRDAAFGDAASGGDSSGSESDASFKDPSARAVSDKVVRTLSMSDSVAFCRSFVGHWGPSLGRIAQVACVFETRRDGACGTAAVDACIDGKIDDVDLDCSTGLSAADRDCDVSAGEVYDCLDAWAASHKEWAAKFTCTGPIDELGPLLDKGPTKPELCVGTETKCPGMLKGLFD